MHKHQAMKCVGMGMTPHILTSASDGGDWSVSRLTCYRYLLDRKLDGVQSLNNLGMCICNIQRVLSHQNQRDVIVTLTISNENLYLRQMKLFIRNISLSHTQNLLYGSTIPFMRFCGLINKAVRCQLFSLHSIE